MPKKTPPLPKTEPESLNDQEQALSSTLLSELKTPTTADQSPLSKIQSPNELQAPEATQAEVKIPDEPKVAENPPPASHPDESNVPEAPKPQVEPSSKKKLQLPHLSWHLPFQKHKPAVIESADATKQEPVNETTQQVTTEALLKMIDEKTQKLGGDEFLVLRISKQGLLVLTGLVLLIIWVFPLIELSIQKMTSGQTSIPIIQSLWPAPTPDTTNPQPSASPAASQAPLGEVRIRVRLQTNTLDTTEQIKDLLKQAGFSQFDFVYDPQLNPAEVVIATRSENIALKQTLTDVFSGTYHMGSESAELTTDSDFAASVLIGKNSKM